ncbi:hypothetical protein [Salmonirosea aquatica]
MKMVNKPKNNIIKGGTEFPKEKLLLEMLPIIEENVRRVIGFGVA